MRTGQQANINQKLRPFCSSSFGLLRSFRPCTCSLANVCANVSSKLIANGPSLAGDSWPVQVQVRCRWIQLPAAGQLRRISKLNLMFVSLAFVCRRCRRADRATSLPDGQTSGRMMKSQIEIRREREEIAITGQSRARWPAGSAREYGTRTGVARRPISTWLVAMLARL